MNISKSKLFTFLAAMVIIVIVFCAYWPSLTGSFHLDDYDTIINSRIAYLTPLEIVKQYPTRFLVFFTFHINTLINNGANLFGLHITSLAIHILNTFIFFLLTRVLCLHLKRKNALSADFLRANWTALFCALIFGVHPLQSQTTIYITQRFMLLASTFYLTSLYAVARGYLPGKSKITGFLIAALSILVGIFCKEIIVTAPILIIIMVLIFIKCPTRAQIKSIKLYKFILAFLAICALPAIVFFQLGHWDIERITAALNSIGGPITAHTDNLSSYTYLVTQPSVILNYLKLFIFPVGLNIDHDFQLCQHWYSAQCVLPVFFGVTLLYLAWKARKVAPFIIWGFLVFIIALVPQSSIIPTPDLMFEHRAYLANAGLCWSLAGFLALLFLVFRSRKYSLFIVVFAIALTCLFSIMTFQRAKIWDSELSLWNDTYGKSPNKQRVVANYSTALLQVGETDLVIKLIEHNKTVRSTQLPALSAILANAYMQKGMVDEAIANYIIAIKHDRKNLDSRYNLATVYFYYKNDTPKALHHINMIHKYNPNYADAYLLKGYILMNDPEKKDQAKAAFERYLELDPNSVEVPSVKAILAQLN